MFSRIVAFMSVPTGNPELVEAQRIALTRLVPLLYFILLVNGWVLSATFFGKAPDLLTVHLAGALTAVYVVRFVMWWRMRGMAMTTERAAAELRRMNRIAAALSVACPAWALALFPYGGAAEQFHVILFLTISMISAMFCMLHLRSASVLATVIVGTAFVGFLVSTGNPAFIAMAANVFFVAVALLVVVLIQNRDFARMVDAQTEARRKHQEQSRLLHMIDDMPVAVMTVEPGTFNIDYANDASREVIRRIEHLLPITADELLGTSIDVFHRHPEHQRRILSDPANLPHSARIGLGPEMLDLKVSAVRDDDGRYLGPMLTWAIVTKEVEAENRIRQLAHYDTLTGLPNRNTFHEHLEEILASPDSRVGLLFIDLDGFKLVNDTKGHRVGDALLKQVAERLRAACGAPGVAIGRLGGDEFAVLVPGGDAGRMEKLAGALVGALGAPYRLDRDLQVRIGASIGIAIAPRDGGDAGTLQTRADIALYTAKAAGKSTARMFSAEMETRIQEQVRLESKLRAALDERAGLFVFYQPIVDIGTGRVTAREALVRWHHPQHGWIPPAEFVPVAERSGLIDQLGEFVLNRACSDAAGWEDGARVAVNVSASQLGRGTLAPAVLAALVGSGLSPDRLEVEVTETALLTNEKDSIGDLRRLRDMGVRVALDDFGTGYSSLAHLRAFPFDKIKIDGSFVKDAVDRPDCAAVVRAVADLGKRLGVTTVAEGVETQAHLDRIRREGCVEAQGYLYGRPMPEERDAPLVDALNRSRPAAPAPLAATP